EAEIIERIGRELPLVPALRAHRNDVADRWAYRDGEGEVGVIASISRPFCGDCSRARLAADGQLYLCLFAALGHDLKSALRSGEDDAPLRERIAAIWRGGSDRYSEERAARLAAGHPAEAPGRVEMFRIGG